MSELLAHFHLLRPVALWLILPAALLLWLLMRQRGGSDGGGWERVIAPELLAYLLRRPDAPRRRTWPVWLGIGWLGAIIALAGPTWERLPQPLLQKRDALVIVLDLSLSMFAADVTPTRVERARYKLQDLLDQRSEGVTGLVVFSADAHTVAPLTDDTATIANLLPALTPELMPRYGSNPSAGIAQAIALLRGAEAGSGRILLVTDGVTPDDVTAIAAQLEAGSWELSILAVGTAAGGPVRLGDALLRDRSGAIVVPRLETGPIADLAAATDGRWRELQLDDSDLRFLIPVATGDSQQWQESEERFDQWRERGPLLIAVLLPLFALAARRGWLLLLPLVLLPLSPPAAAFEWRDLWQRPDQQGAELLQAGKPDEAAQRFRDPAWRGSAHYRAGEFEAAAEAFDQVESADGLYNLGNALAQSGQLRQALAAYDAALARDPDLTDASANRDLVAQELQRQLQQAQQEQQGQQGQQGDGDNAASDTAPPSSSPSPDQDPSSADDPGQGSPPDPATAGDGEAGSEADAQPDQPPTDEDVGDGNGGDHDPESDSSPPSDGAGQDEPADLGDRSERADAGMPPADAGEASGAAHPAEDNSDESGAAGSLLAGDTDEQLPGDAAVEQWLRRIPDDPAGLLRRKFEYESRQRAMEGTDGYDPAQPLW